MEDSYFERLSSACQRNGVSIWRFPDAPAEYRELVEPTPDLECVFHVPAGLIDKTAGYTGGGGWAWFNDDADGKLLSFLNDWPKRPGLSQYAGDDVGWSTLFPLSDGSWVAITEGPDS